MLADKKKAFEENLEASSSCRKTKKETLSIVGSLRSGTLPKEAGRYTAARKKMADYVGPLGWRMQTFVFATAAR